MGLIHVKTKRWLNMLQSQLKDSVRLNETDAYFYCFHYILLTFYTELWLSVKSERWSKEGKNDCEQTPATSEKYLKTQLLT